MNRVDEAVDSYRRGAACSQAIVGIYGPLVGLPREQGLKLSSGFASGMRLAQTCGAVTGAFMVLGLKHAGSNCDQLAGRAGVYAAIREFAARFQQRNHTVVCKELLGCDISTPEGAQRAAQEGFCRSICPKLVRDAAEILEEML